jgi:hypothetical protein
MWPFKKKASSEPEAPRANSEKVGIRAAVDEAIRATGLIKPEAANAIASFINEDDCTRAVLRYRKREPQISDVEKKKLGIRKNGFFSQKALSELTEKGMPNALYAHESVTHRAMNTMGRQREINTALEMKFEIEYLASHQTECRACRELDGKSCDARNASPFPPERCDDVNCRLAIACKIPD